jgi:aminoglycoside N3'-acetyltransferase
MSSEDVIARTDSPRTVDTLARDLRALRVPAGGTVLVHSSLSSLGWVAGGPVAVVQALFAVLGAEGTLAMRRTAATSRIPRGGAIRRFPPSGSMRSARRCLRTTRA